MIAASFPRPAHRAMADQLWPLAGLSAALSIVALSGLALDARVLDGANVWMKPLKFALSFVVYFATLALVVDRLGARVRQGWGVALGVAVAAVAAIGELGYLFVMAGRGMRSHFNESTELYFLLYNLMGVGAVSLVAVIAAIGIIAWRDKEARLTPGLRLGILLGFVASTVLTLITAGYLSDIGGHFVGIPVDGAATLPILGWSGTVGDLRPAHFLALHAMQVLPLLGLAADRRGWPRLTVGAGTLAYVALTAAVFAQALAGLPLIRL